MSITAHLSHVALASADTAGMERFYRHVVGLAPAEKLADGTSRLGWGTGDHVLELVAGEGIDHFGLEVPDPDDLRLLEERLRQAGVEARWCEPPGQHPPALSFQDPDGHNVELHGPVDRSGERCADSGRRPIRIHHVTLSTPDVPALADFYVETLGFKLSDRMGERFMWLRANREHHTVAIVHGPPGGLDHYAYEVHSWDDLKTWCDELAVRRVPVCWGPGRHGPGNNLFIMFDDPAGNHVELSCELERFWDDRVRYPAPRDWEAGDATVNLWGPAPDWRSPLASSAAARER